jgi:hypothetical protein
VSLPLSLSSTLRALWHTPKGVWRLSAEGPVFDGPRLLCVVQLAEVVERKLDQLRAAGPHPYSCIECKEPGEE